MERSNATPMETEQVNGLIRRSWRRWWPSVSSAAATCSAYL